MRALSAILIVVLWASAPAAAQKPKPADATIITQDIENFWRAFDRLADARTREDSIRAFTEEYFGPASPGLEDFIEARIGSAEDLVGTVSAGSAYYASIRPSTLRVREFEAEIRKDLEALEAVYPDAVFPDIYFVIGRLSSAGTTAPDKILIGTEMISRPPDAPLHELNDWLRTVLRPIEDAAAIVAHELIHIQQRPTEQRTLLVAALREGIADFVAELVSGKNINDHLKPWAEPREAELWAEFRERMDGDDFTGWLYGGDDGEGRPADLGYWMGYRIAQSYYDRTADEGAAIRELLTFEDPHEFLRRSGYAERFDR